MKALVAIHEIVLGRGNVVSPGDSFQAEDDVASFLLAAGAAQVDEAEDAQLVEGPGTDLSKLNKAALVALAAERGVEIEADATKAQIIEALSAQDEELV